jgi:Kef-type K+ transport system membrane component KefB
MVTHEIVATLSSEQVAGRVLLDVAIVIAAARLCGMLLRALHQPPVLGEIIGGIALGPSLLGVIPGDPSAHLFPAEVRAGLSAIGGIGLVLFMFIVGLELELATVRRHDRTVLSVSAGSVALPFACGIGLAALLYDHHSLVGTTKVSFAPFALFVATALSITAFPVLVRILRDRGWQQTQIGTVATSCAAVQDSVGWILLVVSLVALKAHGVSPLLRVVFETAAFICVLVAVVRPLLRFALRRWSPSGELSANTLAIAVVGLIASAGTTQLIGIHSVMGAFAFGVAFPRSESPRFVEGVSRALRPTTMSVLLPIYFLSPGLNVDLTKLDSRAPIELIAIFVCACVGKLLGSMIGARVAGLRGNDAHRLAALMNTRGLIELIVLNVGLTAGVLDHQLFTELVVMAVVTTMMTGPLLDLIQTRAAKRRTSALDETLAVGDPRMV